MTLRKQKLLDIKFNQMTNSYKKNKYKKSEDFIFISKNMEMYLVFHSFPTNPCYILV